jgi:hypothetical protein
MLFKHQEAKNLVQRNIGADDAPVAFVQLCRAENG